MAGLDRQVSENLCVWWNGVPWFLFSEGGKDRAPTTAEKCTAVSYLVTFLDIVRPKALVAMGRPAQEVCDFAGVEHLKARHPSSFSYKTVEADILDPLAEALRRTR